MGAIQLELHVPDFEPVRRFYGTFGFEATLPDPEYLLMTRGEVEIRFWPGNQRVLDQPYFKRFGSETPRGYGVEIVVESQSLDRDYETAMSLDAVVEPLKTKPWGQRDFRCVDAFGYYLRFTEPR